MKNFTCHGDNAHELKYNNTAQIKIQYFFSKKKKLMKNTDEHR